MNALLCELLIINLHVYAAFVYWLINYSFWNISYSSKISILYNTIPWENYAISLFTWIYDIDDANIYCMMFSTWIGEVLDVEIIKSNFETMLLNNAENEEMMSIDDETDYDDEVKKDGSIDIGEISSQYLALELF